MRDKLAITTAFFMIIIIGVILFFQYPPKFDIKTENKQSPALNLTVTSSHTSTTIKIPAVDNEGRGVIAALKVQAIPGEGRTLVNVDNLLFWVDTQYSIRTAKHVAEDITNVDASGIDLIYGIETNASVIEGQSAGAALTIATIAVLENKSLRNDVIITGTIDSDGRIGPVGGILAKATASKDSGATLFLVPEGQGVQINYKPEQICQKRGPITFCTTEYKEERVDISKDVGIDVREISTIDDVLQYFFIN